MENGNKKSKAPLIIIVSILLVVAIVLAIVLPKFLKGNNGPGGSNQTETKLTYYSGTEAGWLTMEAMAEVFEGTVEIKYWSDYRVDNCQLITETVSLDSFIYVPMNGELQLNNDDYRYYEEITFTFKFDQRLKIEQFKYQEKGNPNESYVDSNKNGKYISNSTNFKLSYFYQDYIYISGLVMTETPYARTQLFNLVEINWSNYNRTKKGTDIYTPDLDTSNKKFTLYFGQKDVGFGNIPTSENDEGEECYHMAKTCIYDFKFKIDTTIF